MFIVSLQKIIVVISFGRCRMANPREAGAGKSKLSLIFVFIVPLAAVKQKHFFGGDGALGV